MERSRPRFCPPDAGEPPPRHVIDVGMVAKIWLQPISVEYNHGHNRAQLDHILKLTKENRTRLLENWNEYFAR